MGCAFSTMPPCCNTCQWVVNVQGCPGVNAQGAAVTVSQGGTTVTSGTTDASGNFCVNVAAGTYTVQVTATNCQTWSQSVGYGGGSLQTDVQLTPSAGYAYIGPCFPPVVPPSTVHLTDPLGAVSLSYQGMGSDPVTSAAAAVYYGTYSNTPTSYPCTGGTVTTPTKVVSYWLFLGCGSRLVMYGTYLAGDPLPTCAAISPTPYSQSSTSAFATDANNYSWPCGTDYGTGGEDVSEGNPTGIAQGNTGGPQLTCSPVTGGVGSLSAHGPIGVQTNSWLYHFYGISPTSGTLPGGKSPCPTITFSVP
jgi:hypothetical protein